MTVIDAYTLVTVMYTSVTVIFFMELGGGVGDVPVWCRDGAYVEFGFR